MLVFYLNLIDTDEEKSTFEKLYNEYKNLMKYIAYDILKNDALAEDAVQDAFIRMIRYLNRIEDVYCHKTKSLVVIVIKHAAIDVLRKENRQKYVDIEKVKNTLASKDSVEENLDIEEIVEKIKKLPDMYRDVLELKIYHELSDKEIGHLLNISHGAARKRIERARSALYKLLEE